jgi:propanediol dehydratase large subunit
MDKIKLSEIDIKYLNELERSSTLVCKYYESSIKNYDGTINTNMSEYNDFNYYNNIRREIIKEMESRLKNIEFENV